MLSPKQLFAGAVAAALLVLPAYAFDLGRPASSDEIKLWDIDVRPDGKGLPDGSGRSQFGILADAVAGTNGKGLADPSDFGRRKRGISHPARAPRAVQRFRS